MRIDFLLKLTRFKSNFFNKLSKREFCKKNMNITLLKALDDNYMYVLVDEITKETAVVDPVDANRVLEYIESNNLKLKKILTTHHHWDHAGGNIELLSKYKKEKLKVYGSNDDRIMGLNHILKENDLIKLGALEINCLLTPCHTSGHVCYFVKKPDSDLDPCVFTGDTLFVGGCGKFFEGTADQMYDALINKLSKLPDNTKVYCGHEYTVKNLEFALTIEPKNENLISKLKWAKDKVEKKEPTIPSTILEEKMYNPFMRVNEESVKSMLKTSSPVEAMKLLRSLKNKF